MRASLVAITLALFPLTASAQTFFGPVPYLSVADSPLDKSGSFRLETFEDGLLNVPGVTSSTAAIVDPGGITDSVDADDGSIDGSGTGGHSWFYVDGSTGITFTFSVAALGASPVEAGIVWTDGGSGSTVTFEAFDANGASLGSIVALNQGDGSFSGGTAEDRFFGISYTGGIGSIHIASSFGGIEVDHLQFATPGPWSVLAGGKAGSLGLPLLLGSGDLDAGSSNQLSLLSGHPLSTATLVVGATLLDAPFKGGTMVPFPTLLVPLPTDASGATTLPFVLPSLPPGIALWFQFWIQDPLATHGLSASNGLKAVTA